MCIKFSNRRNNFKYEIINYLASWNTNIVQTVLSGDPLSQSKSFDVTLMIILIRNLADPTSSAAEYNRLPLSIDISRTADLARIKHYRNQLSHCEDGKIKSACFITAWEDLSGVRLFYIIPPTDFREFNWFLDVTCWTYKLNTWCAKHGIFLDIAYYKTSSVTYTKIVFFSSIR